MEVKKQLIFDESLFKYSFELRQCSSSKVTIFRMKNIILNHILIEDQFAYLFSLNSASL